MRGNYGVLHRVSPFPEEQRIEQQCVDRNENKDKGFGKDTGLFIVLSLKSFVADVLLLQFLVYLQTGVSGIVVIHVKLRGQWSGKRGGAEQSKGEVIDHVQEYEQLKRLHVPNSASLEIFTA